MARFGVLKTVDGCHAHHFQELFKGHFSVEGVHEFFFSGGWVYQLVVGERLEVAEARGVTTDLVVNALKPSVVVFLGQNPFIIVD